MPKLKKGSAAAKAYMAKIRSKKNVSGLLGVKKAGHHTAVYYDRIRPHTKAKRVGALPVGFTGKFYGVPFKIYNQYTIDGGVMAIAENTKTGSVICSIDGKNTEKAAEAFYSHIANNHEMGEGYYVEKKDLPIIKKDVNKFVKQLAGEVLAYNKGNKQTEAPKKINIKKPVAAKLPVDRFTKNTLRETLKSQKLRLPGGYSLLHRRVSGLFDTSTIKELDDLKKQYYKLAKKYHPDTGGTKEQFQALQKEYDNLFKSILSGSSLNSDQKKNEVDIDEAMRKIIDTIISIPDLNIELVGKWLWISGFTFPYRKELKAAGLSYIAPRKMWAYKGVKSRGGGGDMDDIRAKYGSTPIKPTGGRYIAAPELNKAQKNKLRIYLKKVILKLNKRII